MEKVSIMHCHFSDHKAVTTELCFKERVRVRNFWRHNDDLLGIPEYIKYMKDSIDEGIEKYHNETGETSREDSRRKWEFLKYFLGKQSRKFSKLLAAEKEATKTSLTQELETCEKDPVRNKLQILEIRNTLDTFKMEEDRKAIIQSRVSFAEHNEKPTSFFMRKIKQNYLESNVIELMKDGSKLTRDECNNEIYHFYKELYTSKKINPPSGRHIVGGRYLLLKKYDIAESWTMSHTHPKVP